MARSTSCRQTFEKPSCPTLRPGAFGPALRRSPETSGSAGLLRPGRTPQGNAASRSASTRCAEVCAGRAAGRDARTAEARRQHRRWGSGLLRRRPAGAGHASRRAQSAMVRTVGQTTLRISAVEVTSLRTATARAPPVCSWPDRSADGVAALPRGPVGNPRCARGPACHRCCRLSVSPAAGVSSPVARTARK